MILMLLVSATDIQVGFFKSRVQVVVVFGLRGQRLFFPQNTGSYSLSFPELFLMQQLCAQVNTMFASFLFLFSFF